MLDFITANAELLGVLINAAMLCVWVVYLQLLLDNYRRQRHSSILITRGAGSGLRARCLITNMSAEPLYVTSLIARLSVGQKTHDIQLTDMRDVPEDLGTDPRSAMRQGSLETGRYLDIGHFDALIDQLIRSDPTIGQSDDVELIELTVVALSGSDRLPVGAKRSFRIERYGEPGGRITPLTVATRQIHGTRERRKLEKEIARFL